MIIKKNKRHQQSKMFERKRRGLAILLVLPINEDLVEQCVFNEKQEQTEPAKK